MDRNLLTRLRNRAVTFSRERSSLVLAAGLLTACSVLAGSSATARIHNFGEVNPGVFRGAAPTSQGLQDLRAMGVKLVVDLREPGIETAGEKSLVEHLGMKYINIPFSPWSAPDPKNVGAVLELLGVANGAQPAFVHCRRGKDRTGTVVACYRIQHDRWSREQAIQEANRYGMSWTERGMRTFVLHFAPAPLTPLTLAH